MLRLWVPDGLLQEAAELGLPPSAARHAQVRRVQPGDRLTLFDGSGGQWQAEVLAMGRSQVQVRVLAHEAVERELPFAVTLAVAVPSGERMDWLVEKATELGAATFFPLYSERVQGRLEGPRADRKREHWQAVAQAACEQCGRNRVPEVQPLQSLRSFLAAPPACQRWLLSPGAAARASHPSPGQTAVLLSGPEGGFSDDEVQAARAAGFAAVSLGPRVLRAETAPLALLSHWGFSGA